MKLLIIVSICTFLSNSTSACDDKVLGSIDPAVVRNILLNYLPQFRFCYQKELEKGFQGTSFINLHFKIGPSGNVLDSEAHSKSYFPDDIKRCLVSVMKVMQFPALLGGGTAEVEQPIYFYGRKD